MKIRHFINVRESMRVPMTQEIRAAELRNALKYVLLRFIAFHAFLSRNFERKWKNISFQNLQKIKFVAHVIY